MEIIENLSDLDLINKYRPLALIPTMGNLHEGHLGLIKYALKLNLSPMVTIFVNPLQFGPAEDFSKYPRTIEEDLRLLKKEKCKLVFIPDGKKILENIKELKAPFSNFLCSKSRPGHFDGVLTIVNRFLELIKPEYCIFGQKDFQQQLIIKEHLKNSELSTKLITNPIIRDKNGLALSSRNNYLSKRDKLKAAKIYFYLKEISAELIKVILNKNDFKKELDFLKSSYREIFLKENFKVDYLEFVNAKTLEDLKKKDSEILIAVAINYAGVRLIDNIFLTRPIS